MKKPRKNAAENFLSNAILQKGIALMKIYRFIAGQKGTLDDLIKNYSNREGSFPQAHILTYSEFWV